MSEDGAGDSLAAKHVLGVVFVTSGDGSSYTLPEGPCLTLYAFVRWLSGVTGVVCGHGKGKLIGMCFEMDLGHP